MFRRKPGIEIKDIVIDINEPDLNKLDNRNSKDHIKKDNNLIIQNPLDKLNLIGMNFEKINSPRHTNAKTQIHIIADRSANEIREKLERHKTQKTTITEFTETNKASRPKIDENYDNTKLFTNLVRVKLLIEKLNNKTSSGLDTIPPIIIKNLRGEVIKDYTIIFNNAINNTYYPKKLTEAKLLLLGKPGKDPTNRTSYKPISITYCISKIFQKIIKYSIDEHI